MVNPMMPGAFFEIHRSNGASVGFTYPTIAFGPPNAALVLWEDDRLDGQSQDIAGRKVGNRLFMNDLESGDKVDRQGHAR